jgi:hypothetical protein
MYLKLQSSSGINNAGRLMFPAVQLEVPEKMLFKQIFHNLRFVFKRPIFSLANSLEYAIFITTNHSPFFWAYVGLPDK